MMCVGFDPVEDASARVLILGTLPGAESLRLGEYYANRANNFWRIMGDLVGAMPEMSYQDRLCRLKKNGIAVWDVCLSADRRGSLDSRIVQSSIIPNEFGRFLQAHSRIRLIGFNGQPAERMFRRQVASDISQFGCVVLPSTSSAHTIPYQEKLSRWRGALAKSIDFA